VVKGWCTDAGCEVASRGVYCGTVGYLAPANAAGPRARFNVAIRTVVQDARSGTAVYGVGGGITWDSRAAAEYDETVAKARVLTARRPPVRLLETLAHEPGTGYRRLEEHLERLRLRYSPQRLKRGLDTGRNFRRHKPLDLFYL